jgi:hypothetical protein
LRSVWKGNSRRTSKVKRGKYSEFIMAKREMKWTKEKAFEGLRCSQCRWLFPNPKRSDAQDKKAFLAEAQTSFDSHDCEKYPSVAKRMQQN